MEELLEKFNEEFRGPSMEFFNLKYDSIEGEQICFSCEFNNMSANPMGFVQGGIQGSSRSLFAKLIPADKAGEFFGIFNTFGKAGAFMGPALVGIFLAIFKNTIVMLLPILILFVLGFIVLYFVETDEII